MEDNKSVIRSSLMKLKRDFGIIFHIEELMRENMDIDKEDIDKALEKLESEGIITLIDQETIKVNA